MMWPFDSSLGWAWAVGGMIWMVVFWGGLIALVIWGIKKLAGGGSSSSGKSALDIAKERYARGEITAEEYRKIKEDLNS